MHNFSFRKIYWNSVWGKVKDSIDSKRKTIVFGIFSLILGGGLYFIFRGKEALIDEIEILIAFSILPGILFSIIFFVWFMITTPAILYRKQQERILQLEKAIDNRDTRIKIRLEVDNPPIVGSEKWVRLKLYNLEHDSIVECYVELVKIFSNGEKEIKHISLPIKLSWGFSNPHEKGKLEIERNSSAILDIAKTDRKLNQFCFTTIRDEMFRQEPGEYVILLRIGGKSTGIARVPIERKYEINFKGGTILSINSIS